MLAELTDTGVWDSLVEVGTVGAAFGFLGLLIGGAIEMVGSRRRARPPAWSETTVKWTIALGGVGAFVQALGELGIPLI